MKLCFRQKRDKKRQILGDLLRFEINTYPYINQIWGGGGLRVKIGHHRIGVCAEMGQNRIRGDWGGGQKNAKNVGHHLCTFPGDRPPTP